MLLCPFLTLASDAKYVVDVKKAHNFRTRNHELMNQVNNYSSADLQIYRRITSPSLANAQHACYVRRDFREPNTMVAGKIVPQPRANSSRTLQSSVKPVNEHDLEIYPSPFQVMPNKQTIFAETSASPTTWSPGRSHRARRARAPTHLGHFAPRVVDQCFMISSEEQIGR